MRPRSASGKQGLGIKKARREGRTIVFLEVSGLSQRPHCARAWTPRGQTPIITFNLNWKSLSAIAGLTLRTFFFQLHAGAIKSPQVIGFLRAMHRRIRGKVLLVWDGAPIHRSRIVTDLIEEQHHWFHADNACLATRQN